MPSTSYVQKLRDMVMSIWVEKNYKKIGKILHFLNDAFQLYYDPFQVNWLVQK